MSMMLIILCGGKATRLKGVNKHLPKALLKVMGQSVLTRLVQGFKGYSDELIISCASDRSLYEICVKQELYPDLASRITYDIDQDQIGTAYAAQKCDFSSEKAVTVVNGDTLFGDFASLMPRTVEANEIIFSTSYQSVGRSGVVSVSPETGIISVEQDRLGHSDKAGWVTNGVISMGHRAAGVFKRTSLLQFEGLEAALLRLQSEKSCNFRLHQSATKFVDFGVPEQFLNADKYFSEVQNQ